MPKLEANPRNKPGARRFRTRRRWLWIGVLAALALMLVVCLVYGIWASTFDPFWTCPSSARPFCQNKPPRGWVARQETA